MSLPWAAVLFALDGTLADVHDDMVAPYPGAGGLLAALRNEGVALAVVTSRHLDMADRTLARCGFVGAYDVLVTAADVTRATPDPEPVHLALGRLGLRGQAADCLFVGDSPFDIRAGRAGGTYSAGALWGPFDGDLLRAEQADFYVGSLGEVLGLRPSGPPRGKQGLPGRG